MNGQKIMHRTLAISVVFVSVLLVARAEAGEPKTVPAKETVQAVLVAGPQDRSPSAVIRWVRSMDGSREAVRPPTKLAIIACRVDAQPERAGSQAPQATEPDWRLPVECMRVIETVTDAAAMSHLWLRQMTPNLANYGTCAEVAMTYAPVWEASHRNWLIVKVGCPTKIVDADGRTIGWHMPECQGTLPGTTYPLRCRFDPSEI